MPTAAQIAMIDRELELFKSGAMSGDFMRRPGQPPGPGPQEQKIITQLTVAKMSPAEKAAYEERKRLQAIADAQQRARTNAFKYTKVATLTKDKTNPVIEKLRALSLDDENPDQWLLFYRSFGWARDVVGTPLGKFRFRWSKNGKPVYVAWTEQSWTNFFTQVQRGRWIPNIPAMYKCSPEWATHWIAEYTKHSENAAAQFGQFDPRHVWQYKSGDAKCKRKRESLWMKIRTPVVAAVAIVAAVYLGPIVYGKIMGAMGGGAGAGGAGAAGGAAGSGASAVAQATTFQKIQAGTKTLLGYVNKARTIKAVVNGELPPPPIGIPGANFADWAMIVAKEQIKKEAIDFAMEKGVEYIEKKMTEKEEAKLRAEIEAMQREINALVPPEVKKMPPEPDPELSPTLKKIQIIEVKRKNDLNKLLVPGLIVAGALLLGV